VISGRNGVVLRRFWWFDKGVDAVGEEIAGGVERVYRFEPP
jgi:hypothetical protein